MRVPKIIWKHNLLIHSSSSRAADPVQWSNFPQQQDALEKKFSTTWSTLFCCSLWKSPLYFLSCPIQNTWTQVLVSTFETILLTKQNFFVRKRNTDVGFARSFGLQFHLFWCSVAFHRSPPSLTQCKMRGGELLCHARNKGVNLEYDFLRSSVRWEW